MTVATTVPLISYTGIGTATPLAVPFRFLVGTDIVVEAIVEGVRTVLTHGTHYSLTGAGEAAGGTVTPEAGIPVGTIWEIRRVTPLEQPTEYSDMNDFPAESHEAALDRQMMALQEKSIDVARALKVPRGEVAPEMDSLADADGKVLAVIGGIVRAIENTPAAVEQSLEDIEAAKDEAVEAAAGAKGSELLAFEYRADMFAANIYRTGLARATKAALDVLPGPFEEGVSAAVYDNADLNGIYSYTSGAWVKLAELPDEAAELAADRAEDARDAAESTAQLEVSIATAGMLAALAQNTTAIARSAAVIATHHAFGD